MLLFIMFFVVLGAIFYISSIFNVGMGGAILILILMLIGIPYAISIINGYLRDKKENSMKEKFKNPNTSEEEKERIREYFNQKRLEEEHKERIERFEAIRNENLRGSLKEVYYLGGHEKIAFSQKVDIYLYPDRITFYPSKSREVLFTINGEQIEKVRYETINENTKELILNITGASVPINEITQVMVINYISDYGIENEITISTGGKQDRNLYGLINVIRNDGQKRRQFNKGRLT